MTKRQAVIRVKAILLVLGEIVWRSFGLLIKFLPAGLAFGGVLAAVTKDTAMVAWGIVGSWLPALFAAYAEIGEEIARTAKVTEAGINRGFAKGVQIIEQTERDLAEKAARK
jgi:hypothetical protein